MRIGFVGDVHGLAFHALAAAGIWQRDGAKLDLLIQVGDMGAYPDPTQTDPSTARYIEVDPAQADFARLLSAEGELAERIRALSASLSGSLHFIRGNHEDFTWLDSLEVDPDSATAAVDVLDALRFIPDGTVLEFDGVRLAFLGGAEEAPGRAGLDRPAYESVLSREPGSIDVLVSHQGPYGTTRGYRGDLHGSPAMTALIEHLRPAYHVAGHAHQLVEPRQFGRTTYMGLNSLVASARWEPDARGLQPGCMGLLDTETSSLEPLTDDWLAEFPTPFDFAPWFDEWN